MRSEYRSMLGMLDHLNPLKSDNLVNALTLHLRNGGNFKCAEVQVLHGLIWARSFHHQDRHAVFPVDELSGIDVDLNHDRCRLQDLPHLRAALSHLEKRSKS